MLVYQRVCDRLIVFLVDWKVYPVRRICAFGGEHLRLVSTNGLDYDENKNYQIEYGRVCRIQFIIIFLLVMTITGGHASYAQTDPTPV